MILFSNVKKTICLQFLRFDTRNIISIKLREVFFFKFIFKYIFDILILIFISLIVIFQNEYIK